MLKYRLWQLRKTFSTNTKTTLSSKRLSIAVEEKSTSIINLVGYVILFLTLLDFGFLLASSQVFDPSWAYNTSGRLVESVWGLLLGFLLIFYRRDQDLISPKEFKLLSLISWLVLAIAIGYLAIAPVILGNAFRIHRGAKAQLTAQVNWQQQQIEQLQQQLDSAPPEQLNALLGDRQQTSQTPPDSIPELKTKLIAEAQQKQVVAEQQLNTQLNQQTKSLFKTTIKWLIGAIISGFSFIWIWKYTAWTRKQY